MSTKKKKHTVQCVPGEKMKVNISPEHARLSTLANVQLAFVVWSVLRDDIRKNQTSGHYTKSDVKSLCADLSYTKRHWTRIFSSGDGIFWGSDDKIIHIRSMKHATKVLQKVANSRIDVRDAFKVNVTVQLPENASTQLIYANLYWSWFIARGEVTISRDELETIFGLSHDQQRAYETVLGKKILIRSNYCLIDADFYQNDPVELPEHSATFGYERFTAADVVVQVTAIQYQLPNTYIARADNGSELPTTTAPQSLVRANSARLWYAGYPHKQSQLYFAKYRDFERFGSEKSYIRTYFNGKRRLWRRGQYF